MDIICPDCKGRKIIEIMGGVIVKRCETCKGKGELLKVETMSTGDTSVTKKRKKKNNKKVRSLR